MENLIAFISSNARKLYVEDIYRTMTYPKDYVIQFRYQFKHIEGKLRQNLNDLKGRSSIIYYCYDPIISSYKGTINDESKNNVKTYIPIRKATIKEIEVNNEIGQINFYLQLHEFIDIKIYEHTNLLNPEFEGINVYEVDVLHTRESNWLEKVKNVKRYFGEISFIHIKGIDGKYKLKYSSKEKRTNLHLIDDKSYVFEFLTYDNTEGEGEVKISTDKSFINLNEDLEKGTKINSKKITLDTRPIDFRKDRTYIEIKDCTSEFGVKLLVKLRKQLKRSVIFGVLSSLALFSYQATNLLIRDNFNKSNVIFLVFAALLVSFVVTILHWFYNKE